MTYFDRLRLKLSARENADGVLQFNLLLFLGNEYCCCMLCFEVLWFFSNEVSLQHVVNLEKGHC